MSEHIKNARKDGPYNIKIPQSKRRDCVSGKICFVSPRDANHALRGMWAVQDCTGLEPYLCVHCDRYHLGHRSEYVDLTLEKKTKEL